jgi:hypothetical protein
MGYVGGREKEGKGKGGREGEGEGEGGGRVDLLGHTGYYLFHIHGVLVALDGAGCGGGQWGM